mmetsp:Transcript_10316/g.18185  ORF Transcript_10316/g.18185 Transcript_10316/m.18185 type:complete len:528 (-) Transcript_10316:76-1659(-)
MLPSVEEPGEKDQGRCRLPATADASGTDCAFQESTTATDVAGRKSSLATSVSKGQRNGCLPSLAPGAHLGNLIALLLHAFSTVLLLSFGNSMQTFLLRDIYGVDTDDMGTTTGKLGLADEIWSIAWLGLWGALSDRYGRMWVCVVGYFQTALGLALMPHAQTTFPGLLCVRLLFAQGAAAISSMLTALMADFLLPESLGSGSGLVGLFSGLGAVVSVFVFVGTVPKTLCVSASYYIVALYSLSMTFVSFFLLNPPLPQPSGTPRAPCDDTGECSQNDRELYRTTILTKLQLCLSDISQAWTVLRQDLRLCVAVFSGFHARAGTVLISVWIPLWVSVYFDNSGADCGSLDNTTLEDSLSVCGEVLLNSDKSDCPKAFTETGKIGGVTQTVALLTALVIGALAGRSKEIMKHLAFWSIFSVVAFASIIVIESPLDKLVYLTSVLWGIAEISLVVIAQVAITQALIPYPSLRGTFAGMFSVVGALGVVTISYLGGLLFDTWIPEAPFILMSIACALLFLTSAALFCNAHR